MYLLFRISEEFMSHEHRYGLLASRNKKMLESLALRLTRVSSDDYQVIKVNGISKRAALIDCISQHESDSNYSIIKDFDFREKWVGNPELIYHLKHLKDQGCSGLSVKQIPVLNEIRTAHIVDLYSLCNHELNLKVKSIQDVYFIEKRLKSSSSRKNH